MISQMFCLPYAGGSSSIYRGWIFQLKSSIKIELIEYAGRGSRFCDTYFRSIEEAAEDASVQIRKRCKGNYVIFGHSMGCLVALETIFILTKQQAILPRAVIMAATRPPHLMCKDRKLGTLSKAELMQKIASMGQMELEVLASKELYEIISEILYADVQMFTKYKRQYEDGKIDIPLLALAGDNDNEAPAEDMKEWRYYTSKSFECHTLNGNHFFPFNNSEQFYDCILKYIRRQVGEGSYQKKDSLHS